ncbi:Pentatricopeptide repeat [Dillenia turbinata]|uniref:Pentatricopeptide repeat n=1 Tax=Dillenia turbinata TaxID=194707 RepID=A0AAN8UQX8_9MAGN
MSSLPRVNTIKSISSDLFKERNLKRLVEKFKKSSEIDRFRTKHGIYEEAVHRLAVKKKFQWIEEILEHQKTFKDISKEGFTVRLISLYGKSGMFEHAVKVFDEMPDLKCERSIKSFNALLGACADSKKYDKIDEYFRGLSSKLSIKPDLISYNTVIKAYRDMGSLDSASLMLDEMEKNGIEPDLITFNTLLHGFYENNRFDDGEKLWARMEEKNVIPDVSSYRSRLHGLVNGKRMSDAVELVEKLQKYGPKPDVICYNALIKGFCNDGKLEEAQKWHKELVQKGCVPNKYTFGPFVKLLCEKCEFDKALEMCIESINHRSLMGAALLQQVVDGLVKTSKSEEAKKLVELGWSNNYSHTSLKMPS